jgi:hypothetical protein
MNPSVMLLYFSAILAIAVAQPNYQERVIYYNESMNVCRFTPGSDVIELNINLEGYPLLTVNRWGFTFCADRAFYDRDAISPSPYFSYFDDELKDKIYFENHLTKNYIRGSLINMVVKSNITDDFDATLRGRKCDCKILGDGTKQHFGNIFPDFPKASINLSCKFADQTIE